MWVCLFPTLGPCSLLSLCFLATVRQSVLSALTLCLTTCPQIVVPTGYGLKSLKLWALLPYSVEMVAAAEVFWLQQWKVNWLTHEVDALCTWPSLCWATRCFWVMWARLPWNWMLASRCIWTWGLMALYPAWMAEATSPELAPLCGRIFYVLSLSCVL